ncbi:hypothetical protein GCM10023067_06850 [Aminobacter aganoensis]
MELAAIVGDDAGGFLAAMLERMQAQRDDGRCVLPAKYAEHAAFIVEMIISLGGERCFCVNHRVTVSCRKAVI